MATHSSTLRPHTIEEIFKDYSGRRAGVVRALTDDVDEFYSLCDPDKENLCLFGLPNETWKVTLPAEQVPAELPEPTLGINFARDGMNRGDWLSLVAVHTDSWLLSVAFYYGARFGRDERNHLFSLINDLPTVCEAMVERNPIKERASMDTGIKSKISTNMSNDELSKSNLKPYEDTNEEDDQRRPICGICGLYGNDDVWIDCHVCERWFHGKCVNLTQSEVENIEQYRCRSCSSTESSSQ